MNTQHAPVPRMAEGSLWRTASYAHDRRAHRHRCRYCRCILQAGQAVWMARVADRKTQALHAEPCADAVIPFERTHMTALELLACHAVGYANASIYNQLNDAMLLDAGRAAIAKATGGAA